MRRLGLLCLLLPLFAACEREAEYDLLVRGGTVYDGSGSAGVAGEVAIQGDRIAYVGPKAPGKSSLSDVSIRSDPSQKLTTIISGPNSLSTCRHAPHGAVGDSVGV